MIFLIFRFNKDLEERESYFFFFCISIKFIFSIREIFILFFFLKDYVLKVCIIKFYLKLYNFNFYFNF